MKKLITSVIITSLLSLVGIQSASACSYMYQTPQETYDQSQNVFIGKVLKTSSEGGINGTRSVTFQVLKTYKGSFVDTVTLTTGANSAMCGFEEGALLKGDTWVIHTSSDDSFNSLPNNKWYEFFEDAKSELDPLAQNSEPKFCTLQYAPVCARRDTGIRCVTTPCPSTEDKTYGNSCQAAADNAEYLYDGECRASNSNPVTPKPEPTKPKPILVATSTDYGTGGMYDVPQVETNGESLGEKLWEKVKNFWNWLFWFS